MKNRGYMLLDTLTAAGVAMMLVVIIATQLFVFWQLWHQVTREGRQRQWMTMAQNYLAADISSATGVGITGRRLYIFTGSGTIIYTVSVENSLYRQQGAYNYALAYQVRSANWRLEGEALWTEIVFTDGTTYQSCLWHKP